MSKDKSLPKQFNALVASETISSIKISIILGMQLVVSWLKKLQVCADSECTYQL